METRTAQPIKSASNVRSLSPAYFTLVALALVTAAPIAAILAPVLLLHLFVVPFGFVASAAVLTPFLALGSKHHHSEHGPVAVSATALTAIALTI
jgi:hypothetical protein